MKEIREEYEKTNIRNLISRKVDIDVYDDYDESVSIAFVGPIVLTKEGEDMFEEVLNLSCELHDDRCIICINDLEDADRYADLAVRFFTAAAGYVSMDLFCKWFEKEVSI